MNLGGKIQRGRGYILECEYIFILFSFILFSLETTLCCWLIACQVLFDVFFFFALVGVEPLHHVSFK